MTNPDDRKSAIERMWRREAEVIRAFAWAKGTGNYAGCAPSSEGHARLRALLEESPSDEELADIERSGWSAEWRKNSLNFASFGFHIVGKSDFEVSPNPGLAIVDLDTDPQPVH